MGRPRRHLPRAAGAGAGRQRSGSGVQRDRAVHAARRRGGDAADKRGALRRRRPGDHGGRGADGDDRRRAAAGADRERADLAIGRAEDPLAAAQPAGGLGANGPAAHLDELPGGAADRGSRDRPLFGSRLRTPLRCGAAGVERGARGHPAAANAAATWLVGGDCRQDQRACRGGHRAVGGDAGRLRDDRRRGRGAERRGAGARATRC